MRFSRRRFLAFGASTAGVILVAACAPAPPASPTSAPAKPAEAKPAEAKPAAPAATTAPAAPAAAPAATSAPAATTAPAAASAPTTASAAKPSFAITSDKVTVSMWHGTDATMVDLYKTDLAPGYMKLRPNVTVDDQAVPDVDNKLLVAVASGTQPDMFHTNALNLVNYASRGVLDPIMPEAWGYASQEELIDKAYVQGTTTGMSYQGKLYGAASQLNAQDFVMNNRIWKEAGLDPLKDAPKSWDDVVALNEKLTKKDGSGRITQKGFDWSITSPASWNSIVQMLTWQAGGDILKPDGTAAFNTEFGVKALETLKKVAVDPRTTNATQLSPFQDFADEQVSSRMAGAATGIFVETIQPKMKGNYTFALIPQLNAAKPVSTLTFFAIVVSARSSEQIRKVAWDYHHYVCTQPLLWLKKTGQLQNQKDIQKSPEVKEILPNIDIAVQSMSFGRQLAITTAGNELAAALSKAVERFLYQGMDPKQSLDEAAAELDRAVKK